MKHAVLQHDGEVVKQVADSFFAAFATPPRPSRPPSRDRGHEGLQRVPPGTSATASATTPSTCVAWCPSLIILGENLFGDEVNRAFVLGEDTARANEVLCSPAFGKARSHPGSAPTSPPYSQDAAGFFHVVRDFRDG